MNNRQRRMVEVTLPIIIGYGAVVMTVTTLLGFGYGLLSISLLAMLDIALVKE